MGFKDLLIDKLSENTEFPKELSPFLPSGFQEINKRMIINLKDELDDYIPQIIDVIKFLYPRMNAIWLRKGQISGKFREPEGLTHVWGDKSSETITKEHGIRYKFDFTQIMFAKGNIHERNLLPKRINERINELNLEDLIIVDMFAGIGYFSLGIAKKCNPKKIYSMEWNPTSYKYLKINSELNHVENIIEPILGDCKESSVILKNRDIKADYIIMGLLPAPIDAIEYALLLAKDEGSVVVYEGVESEDSTELFDGFSNICLTNGFSTKIIDRRLVKSFAPHRYHVVLEIELTKKD